MLYQGSKITLWVWGLCVMLTLLLHLQNMQLISTVLLVHPSLQGGMKKMDLVSGARL